MNSPSRCPVSFPEKLEIHDLHGIKHVYAIAVLSLHEGGDSESAGHFSTLARDNTKCYCYGNGPISQISTDVFKKGHINSTKIIMATYTKRRITLLDENDDHNGSESSSQEDDDDFYEDPRNQQNPNDEGDTERPSTEKEQTSVRISITYKQSSQNHASNTMKQCETSTPNSRLYTQRPRTLASKSHLNCQSPDTTWLKMRS